jgi:hypothetical protein
MSTEVIDHRLWIILDHVPNYCLVSLQQKCSYLRIMARPELLNMQIKNYGDLYRYSE